MTDEQIEARLRALDETHEAFARNMRDAWTVQAELEKRHTAGLADHREWLHQHDLALNRHTEWLHKHDQAVAETDKRILDLVSATGELLKRMPPAPGGMCRSRVRTATRA